MKKQIRRNVFETNSSSTHSITICSKSEFEAWKNGELLYNRWRKEKFINPCQDLPDSEKEKAKGNYNIMKDIFWKDWEELNEEAKNKWYLKYLQKNNYEYEDCQSYDEWQDCNDSDLETYECEYTTDGGEEIVVFGKYGYDG